MHCMQTKRKQAEIEIAAGAAGQKLKPEGALCASVGFLLILLAISCVLSRKNQPQVKLLFVLIKFL